MEHVYSGKVRETYEVSGDRLVIVATDRISAFDTVLPQKIRGKGIVLTKLSNFWFGRTRSIVANHILSDRLEDLPEEFQNEAFRDRTVLVRKLNMLPFEFVVRGYLFGSMWNAYQRGEAFCGHRIPQGYQQAQKLETPILTPAVKHDTGHDDYVDASVVKNKLGTEMAEQITDICFKLYEVCGSYALSRGIMIADTKFEFGVDQDGEIILADEIFTPDSSRFWDQEAYEVGTSPRSYDKQFLRDWLQDNREDGEIQFDRVPQEVLEKTEKIYQDCLRRITS